MQAEWLSTPLVMRSPMNEGFWTQPIRRSLYRHGKGNRYLERAGRILERCILIGIAMLNYRTRVHCLHDSQIIIIIIVIANQSHNASHHNMSFTAWISQPLKKSGLHCPKPISWRQLWRGRQGLRGAWTWHPGSRLLVLDVLHGRSVLFTY